MGGPDRPLLLISDSQNRPFSSEGGRILMTFTEDENTLHIRIKAAYIYPRSFKSYTSVREGAARRGGGIEVPLPRHFQRSLKSGSRGGRSNDSSVRPVQAGAGGPVAQGRAGKEGAEMQGRIYKGRHSASSLLRSAESAAGTVGEEGGSRKGERQTAVTSAVQEPGYLFIRYPFSSPSPNLSLPPPLFFPF